MSVTMLRKRLRNESNSESEQGVHKSEIGRTKPDNPEHIRVISDNQKIIEKIETRRRKLKEKYGF